MLSRVMKQLRRKEQFVDKPAANQVTTHTSAVIFEFIKPLEELLRNK